jgi:penicillin-binding protein 1C
MAFEEGLLAPSSLMADEPSDFPAAGGVFSPRNYSGGFSTPVPARTALGSSLNIPAVNLTSSLGVARVLDTLRNLGLGTLDRDHNFYGLGIALGGGEVSLIDLLSAYAALADSGVWKEAVIIPEAPGLPSAGTAAGRHAGTAAGTAPARPSGAIGVPGAAGGPAARRASVRGAAYAEGGAGGAVGAAGGPEGGEGGPEGEDGDAGREDGEGLTLSLQARAGIVGPERARRVFSPEAAFMAVDILSDDKARALGFGEGGVLATPYPSAVKTGTSTSFRDNFCLGFTSRYAVGVWAGNFQARPMARVSGITGAGELWRRVMDRLAEREAPGPLAGPPRGVVRVRVCPVSGLPAGPDCPNSVQDWFPLSRPLPAACDHDGMDLTNVPVLGRELRFGLLRPASREVYALDPEAPPGATRIRALAQSVPGVEELVFVLNGVTVGSRKVEGYARASVSVPLTPGVNVLQVTGLRGTMAPLTDTARYTVM